MARKIEVEIVGDASNFQKSLHQASGSADGFGSSISKLGKIAALGGAALAGGLAYGLKKSVDSAIDFERSMRNVNSIAGLSEKQFGNLGKSVLSMAADVGQKPKVLADGLYDIVSSGFKASDAVKILAVSAKAATAGMTDTATASKAVTASLNAYHQGADQARATSDILFQTVNKGVLTFEELSQQMGDLVPAAAPLGVSLEEVGAGMATLTLQGVPAAEAATRMKNSMLSLAKPTPALSKLLKEQGFASGEAAIKSKGFAGVLDILSEATHGSVSAQAALTPEIRTLLGVVGLTGQNLATYNRILKDMDDATRGAGITAEVFAEQSKSVGVQWQKVTAGFEVFKVQVGTALLPVLSAAMQATSAFFSELNKAEGVGAKLNVVWGTITDGVKEVGAALVAAFQTINWNAAGAALVSGLGRAVAMLQAAVSSINWNAVGQAVGSALVTALNTLSSWIAKVNWNAVGQALVKGFGDVIEALSRFLAGVNWGQVLVAVGKGMIAVLTIQARILLGVAQALGEAIVDGIGKGLANLVPWIRGKLAAIPGALASIAKSLPGAALALGVAIVTGLINGLANLRSALVSKLAAIPGAIAAIAPQVVGAAVSLGAAIADGVISGIGNIGSRIYESAKGGILDAIEGLKRLAKIGSPSKLVADEIGVPLGEGVAVGFLLGTRDLPEKMAASLRTSLEAAKKAVDAAQGTLGDSFGKLGEYVARQFAAKTEFEMDKIAAKFDKQIARITARADAATPAERELANIAANEEKRNRDRASLEAQAALDAANAMEEGVEKERAVAAAKEQIRSADLADRIARLEAEAVVERAAAEKSAAEQIAKLEAAKARELQNYEERRRQMEESLDKQLQALATRLAKHPEEYDKIQKKVKALLDSYGIPMQKSGENLGKAFAAGLRSAADEVEAAAKHLAKIVEKNLKVKSPTEEGPMSDLDSWWSNMGKTLVSGLDYKSVAQGAAKLAGMAAVPPVAISAGGYGGGARASAPAFAAGPRGGNGNTYNFSFPNYAGDKRDLMNMIRTEFGRTIARNS